MRACVLALLLAATSATQPAAPRVATDEWPVYGGDAGASRPELEDDLAWLELAAPDTPFADPRHWAPFVLFGA